LKIFFLVFLLSISTRGEAENVREVSQSAYWKLLLHYHQGFFGERSEADGPGFFLSPEGDRDPLAELNADVSAFGDNGFRPVGPLHQHPQCAFPERFRFLKEKLDLNVKKIPCPDFKAWKDRFNPKSITLVFAAPYMGSPASMFGHTFLRIDSNPEAGLKGKSDLLDYAISFDAVTESDPGPAYVINGLLGFYPGVFSQNPFYLKVNAYHSMENRDLWEYRLNLNIEQIDHFLNHLWEMGTTYFNYYFFKRNCSYQLLSLLEVANPDWNLRSRFGPMAIPIDTVRAIKSNPDGIQKITLRPSLIKIIQGEIDSLNENERRRFFLVKDDISRIQKSDSVKTLDTLMDWQKYLAMTHSLTSQEAERKIDQGLLVLRSEQKIQVSSLGYLASFENSPENGHPSSKLSFVSGIESSNDFLGVELRPAFHDLLDPDLGFLPRSTLVIARARTSFLFGGISRLRLDDFTLGEITSAPPFSRLLKPLSWTLKGGLTRPLDTGCLDCLGEQVQGGGGVTLMVGKSLSLTSLLMGHIEANQFFDRFNGEIYRVGPGILIESLLEISHNAKFSVSFEHVRYFPGADQHFLSKLEGAISFSFQKFDFRLGSNLFISSMTHFESADFDTGIYF